jgi:YD repeat-containing protein
MVPVFMIVLATVLGSTAVMSTPQQPKGPVRSVYAERTTTNSVKEKSASVPWYKETYDGRGRLLESTFFKEDGTVNNTWIYAYLDDNKRNEAALYDSNNALRWKEIYAYDEKGVLREVKLTGSDGVSTAKYFFKYDNLGSKIEWLRSETNGREYTKESYKYDSSGRIAEELLYAAPGVLDSRLAYSYDREGNVKSKLEYTGNGSLAHHWTYKYRYDSHGNWVEQTGTDRRATKTSDSSVEVFEIIHRSIAYKDVK